MIDYIRAAMAFSDIEQFRILFLDKKNQLIADEVQQQGTVDHTPVYAREVMKRALDIGASAIVLVHNHPSGDPTPSPADIEMTSRIVDAGQKLQIAVHDHVIVGRKGHASFRATRPDLTSSSACGVSMSVSTAWSGISTSTTSSARSIEQGLSTAVARHAHECRQMCLAPQHRIAALALMHGYANGAVFGGTEGRDQPACHRLVDKRHVPKADKNGIAVFRHHLQAPAAATSTGHARNPDCARRSPEGPAGAAIT